MKDQIRLPANVAEIQLVYRHKVRPTDQPRALCSSDAYRIFRQSWDEDLIGFREQVKVMLLNVGGHVLGIFELSLGGTTAAIAEVKLIFAAAIRANASSIILAHNHPSGCTAPSNQDNILTRKVFQAGQLLDIQLNDHLIITSDSYLSYSDQGLL